MLGRFRLAPRRMFRGGDTEHDGEGGGVRPRFTLLASNARSPCTMVRLHAKARRFRSTTHRKSVLAHLAALLLGPAGLPPQKPTCGFQPHSCGGGEPATCHRRTCCQRTWRPCGDCWHVCRAVRQRSDNRSRLDYGLSRIVRCCFPATAARAGSGRQDPISVVCAAASTSILSSSAAPTRPSSPA